MTKNIETLRKHHNTQDVQELINFHPRMLVVGLKHLRWPNVSIVGIWEGMFHCHVHATWVVKVVHVGQRAGPYFVCRSALWHPGLAHLPHTTS